MTTYLVLLRCGVDDLPLFVGSRIEADEIAESIEPPDSQFIDDACDAIGVSVTVIHSVSVIEMVDGRPSKVVSHREF